MCLLLCSGLALWCTAATATAANLAPSSNATPLTGPLVVPSTQALIGAEQQQAATEASRDTPEAVMARETSRTEYEQQTAAQAFQTLAATFPSLLSEQQGGPPALPAGQQVTGFASPTVADVALPGGRYDGVIQSAIPMATESGPGHWAGIDLTLHHSGSAFEPKNALIPVRLPTTLASGAELPSLGISMTPTDSHGTPLSGSEPQSGAAGVLFANTETDSDTLLKPTPLGFDTSTVLRSIESPEQLYYKVSVPTGAELIETRSTPRGVHVVKEGQTIGLIPAPEAHDASGARVPVTMRVAGASLVVTVAHRAGSYQYPIVVDPEFWDTWINIDPGMWEFHEWSGYTYSKSKFGLEMTHPSASFVKNDYAAWSEHAQGYTKLYEFYVKDGISPTERTGNGEEEATPSWLVGWIELYNGSSAEGFTRLSHPYVKEASVCQNVNCSPEGVESHNNARFEMTTEAAGTGEWEGNIFDVASAFAEEKGKHSDVHVKSAPIELDATENIFDQNAKSTWLGPHHGAFAFEAVDGGLGVETTHVEFKPSGGSWENYGGQAYFEKAACNNGTIECAPTEEETYNYNALLNGTKHLPEGEGTLRVDAGSALPYSNSYEYNEGEEPLKVDAKAPKLGRIVGFNTNAENNYEYELREAQQAIRVEATDGEGTVPSSGVASIGLEIDGHAITPTVPGICFKGPCTTTGEWSLNGDEFGAGTHLLTIVLTDNAGNIETAHYSLKVDPSTPIAVGPGSVNPESGDFAMEATDVNISGASTGLTVARHYDSRNVTEGEEEPLGPDWSMFLNNVATLQVLPDESVSVLAPSGATEFARTESGTFEPPEGDKDLSLEYKTEYEGKEPAYILSDAKQGTTTVFRLPSGAKHWMGASTRGPIATDSVTDEYTTLEPSAGKKIVTPRLELAPHPALTCAREKLERGCRGLEFIYDEGATTAKGEAESEWGNYKDRLKEVISVAYNPKTGTMAQTAVAAYEYDGLGRLRAEWNPQIKPALKTTYGYDAENHLTAYTPPGQESWAFTYGTIPSDSSTGRLLKVTRAPSTAALWKGSLPVDSGETPTLSGAAAVGVNVTVTRGKWSNEPVVYGFRWQDCNAKGEECTLIPRGHELYLHACCRRSRAHHQGHHHSYQRGRVGDGFE